MGTPTTQLNQYHQMMNFVVTIILTWFSLCSAQQMCVYQDGWTEPKSIVTFNSHSTLHTSTVEDSWVDISNASTTGDIHIGLERALRGRSPSKFYIQLKVVLHSPDSDSLTPSAEVFLQKDGRVTLIDSYNRFDHHGREESKTSIVGFGPLKWNEIENPTKFGYLLLDEHNSVREFHENGYFRPGQTIRLVTGAINGGCFLDISLCVLYDGYL